jgi:xanthine dehydrogenase small subunit
VEGLTPAGQPDLHPVQQAMVDYHASQCGFCTPGIVMALVAWWLNSDVDDLATDAARAQHRHAIEQALSGNLCRCTGYQPIFKAAAALASMPRVPLFMAMSALPAAEKISLAYQQPYNCHQLALAIEAAPKAKWVAGATDLGLEITQQLNPAKAYIDLSQVQELQAITLLDDRVVIGAAATYSQVEAAVAQALPWLCDLIKVIGSRQIRNCGTLGGNLANGSPIADIPPLLLAMECQLLLQQGAQQRTVPIADFFIGYRQTILAQSEYIHAIIIPKPDINCRVWVEKVSKRYEDDISAVCVALVMSVVDGMIKHCRIGLGGMAAQPVMAHKTQLWLTGQTITAIDHGALRQQLSTELAPISDVRASADYRLQVCANLLGHWLQQAACSDVAEGLS